MFGLPGCESTYYNMMERVGIHKREILVDRVVEAQNTQNRYERLISSMRRAEQAIDPVLANLKDNVLYLKHNLNARAIASLRRELKTIDTDVDALIVAMQQAIEESNQFINQLRGDT